jgi:hypothetical protein
VLQRLKSDASIISVSHGSADYFDLTKQVLPGGQPLAQLILNVPSTIEHGSVIRISWEVSEAVGAFDILLIEKQRYQIGDTRPVRYIAVQIPGWLRWFDWTVTPDIRPWFQYEVKIIGFVNKKAIRLAAEAGVVDAIDALANRFTPVLIDAKEVLITDGPACADTPSACRVLFYVLYPTD